MAVLSLSILGFFLAILEYFLRRWIVGTGGREIYDTNGKAIYILGNIILVLAWLLYLFKAIDFTDEEAVKRSLLIFLAIIYVFQSFVEWKYIKSSKAFIVPLLVLLIGLIYCYIFVV
ncbi:DUF4181 domain-containing protein [Bacillus sp. B-jedd]|uniref:DUF4181 domain-containing protein n=1 Tax=Bacillus sp. B-jedd TaxID=1476857 RepID=UPI000515604F|nr:DUF4181 domain-containing protein [Bacillus sp. B-jedd]CEG25579.1 hypothetical protein BN1002_00393 [Bacillus sp. B-jedd]